jgi:hypothetical protein
MQIDWELRAAYTKIVTDPSQETGGLSQHSSSQLETEDLEKQEKKIIWND